jgi:WD40 repeat protein
VYSVAFSSDSKVLATTNDSNFHSGDITFWDPETAKEIKTIDGGLRHGVDELAYSPDGKWFASSHTLDRTILIWR